MATLILIPLISAPQVLGVLFWDDFKASVASTVGMGFLFIMTYLVGIAVAKEGGFQVCKPNYDLKSLGHLIMGWCWKLNESFWTLKS